VGIVLNLLLSAAKLAVGLIFGSISITADATNNLSDAGAQIISLISFKISAKPADRDHPFGHARIEYVASMVVSFIVLLIGFELLTESITKVDFAGNLIVVKTYPGMAGAVATCIDSFNISDIIGCVAGDDAILVVTRDDDTAEELSDKIRHMIRTM
jgi:cation diffusion facilitator family transporter